MTEQIGPAEARKLSSTGKVRLEREEAGVAILAQALQEFRPVCSALSRRHNTAVGTRIFHMHVAQPGTQRLVAIRVGYLPALDKIRGIENGLKMQIVDAL